MYMVIIMNLYLNLLRELLESENVEITFPNLKVNVEQAIESRCYMLLKNIKQIIDDDSLTDKECFQKIEEIICVFEEIGLGGGTRHDFV